MVRFIKTYRALSGSQVVYYTNEESAPSGTTSASLVSTIQLENEELPEGVLPTPIESWTLDGVSGVTGSIDGTQLSVAIGTEAFGPGPIPNTKSLFLNESTRWTTPTTASLQLTGSMSLSFFAYPVDLAGGLNDLVTCAGSTDSEADNSLYSLRFNSNNNLELFREEGATGTNIDTDVNTRHHPGQWYHFVYTRDSGTNENIVYVNGYEVSNTTDNNPTGGTAATLNIGAWPGNSQYFFGFIYQVKVFDRILTPKQVLQIKNSVLGN